MEPNFMPQVSCPTLGELGCSPKHPALSIWPLSSCHCAAPGSGGSVGRDEGLMAVYRQAELAWRQWEFGRTAQMSSLGAMEWPLPHHGSV